MNMYIYPKNNELVLRFLDTPTYSIIKSWNLMKWDKSTQSLRGPISRELLNKLAQITPLDIEVEAERERLNKISTYVEKEKTICEPEPLIEPPVKANLFKHQIRGYNAALVTFGFVNV